MTSSDWVERLRSDEYNQSHLLEAIGDDKEKLEVLVKQLDHCDSTYPGGLKNYLSRARKLLVDSASGVNPFEGFQVSAPQVESPQVGSEDFYELEKIGLGEVCHCAFVLVAGGLGERLGYPDIKIGLLTNITHEITYCEYYFECIAYYQEHARRVLDRPDLQLQVAIMTSGDTHSRTVDLLESNSYFSLDKSQITIMMQEKVPALIDSDARMSIKIETGELETKPHGHGDVHTLLYQRSLPTKWLQDHKLKWVLFFQDTNSLVFRALPAFLGVSCRRNFAMNSLCIPRTPGEAVGAICHLKNPTTHTEYTVNVEYNQLDTLLKSSGMPAGDTAAPAAAGTEAAGDSESGPRSPFPGNCNILLFRLSDYAAVLEETKGGVPEFVNPKYVDSTKTKFKSPTRIECMMQEFARLYDPTKDQLVGATVLPRWFCFSTVKNCIPDAAVKLENGLPAECAFSGESEMYAAAVKCIEIAAKSTGTRVTFGQPVQTTFHRMQLPLGPKLYIDPSWGLSLTCLRNRLAHVASIDVTTRSSLVLKGQISFQSLQLDGDLVLQGPHPQQGYLKLGNIQLQNTGSQFVEVPINDQQYPLKYRVRGYRKVKNDNSSDSVARAD